MAWPFGSAGNDRDADAELAEERLKIMANVAIEQVPLPEQGELSYTFSGNTSVNEEFEAKISGPMSITLPRGITLVDATSTSGNLELKEVDGRQKITYTVPNGEFEDTITFRIEVSWVYLITQFWVYPTFVVLLIFLMIRHKSLFQIIIYLSQYLSMYL